MDTQTSATELSGVRRRDEGILYLAGAAVNLGGVLAATLLEFEPEFALALTLTTALGIPVSWLFRQLNVRRLLVNTGIVLATAAALLVYLYRSPWFSMLTSEGVGRALLSASTLDAYSLLIWAIALLTAFRSFGLLSNRDVVLSILPALSIITLVAVIRPQREVLPHFLLFAGGSVVALLVERRLQHLGLPDQLGSALARRRSLPLSLRTLTVLVGLASVSAYGLTMALGHYQPRSAWVEQYGLELARLVADLMAEAAAVSRTGSTDFLDLATSRGSLRNAVLFEVAASEAVYWRTGTVDHYDGDSWSRTYGRPRRFGMTREGVWLAPQREEYDERLLGQTFTARASIMMALPCAATPIWVQGNFPRVRLHSDGQLSCSQVIAEGESYKVLSVLPEVRSTGGPARLYDSRQYLSLPEMPTQVIELAHQLTRQCPTAREKVERLTDFIRDRCRYTLRPGLLPGDREAVSHFLFESRRGYCVHFATALAVCLRAVGIPSRMVTGFLPGQWDSARNAFLVRERDAHAWVEAFLPESGWTAFDPTNGTLRAPREKNSLLARARASFLGALARLQAVNLRWPLLNGRGLVLYALGAVMLLVPAVALQRLAKRRFRRARKTWSPADDRQQRIASAYERALSLLNRRLAARRTTQTPHEYARFIAQTWPAVGSPFRQLTDLYGECRYGSHPMGGSQVDTATRLLAEVRRDLRRARGQSRQGSR